MRIIQSFLVLFMVCLLSVSMLAQSKITNYQGNNYQKENNRWVLISSSNQKSQIVQNSFIVKTKPGINVTEEFVKRIGGDGISIKEYFEQIDIYIVNISANEDLIEVMKKFSSTDLFEIVEPNVYAKNSCVPTANDWLNTLCEHWNIDAINADKAWKITTGSQDVIVAVIDAGVEHTQRDLNENFDAAYLGKNFGLGADDPDIPSQYYDHGMKCASVIGAETNNGQDISGIAGGWHNGTVYKKGVRLVAYTCSQGDPEDSYSHVPTAGNVTAAFNEIMNRINSGLNIRVVSMSLNWAPEDPIGSLQSVIQTAIDDYGVSVVVSNGNYGAIFNDKQQVIGYDYSGELHFPATMTSVIAVGAVVQDLTWKSFTVQTDYWGSRFGPTVDVCAPGKDIPRLRRDGIAANEFNGTSAACPHVAAVASLLYSVNNDLTPSQLELILKNTTMKEAHMVDEEKYGEGLIDAYAALKYTLEHYGGTVTQDISIPTGETWNFDTPGVVIRFENGAELNVTGTLNVTGNSSNKVVFDFVSPNSSTQNGILVRAGGTANIQHAEIKNAYRGIYANSIQYTIDDSYIHNCTYGLYFEDIPGSTTITDCQITNNSYGLYTDNSTLDFNDSGTSANNKVYNNTSRNVYASWYSNIDLGTDGDAGYNIIKDTSPIFVQAYNYTTVNAKSNWWGTSNTTYIQSKMSSTSSNIYWSALPYEPSLRVDDGDDKILIASNTLVQPDQYISDRNPEELLSKNPESPEAFYALRDMQNTYSKANYRSYLNQLYEKTDRKELYAFAGILDAKYEEDSERYIQQLDKVINKYEGYGIVEFAMYKKFTHYLIDLQEYELAQSVAKEMSTLFPDSPTTEEAQRQINDALNGSELSIVKGNSNNQIEAFEEIPTDYALRGNYPNPFNPSTKISYTLPYKSHVNISVYDITGSLVAELVDNDVNAGYQYVTWNGKNAAGEQAASGIYLYTLKASSLENNETFVKSAKMLLVK